MQEVLYSKNSNNNNVGYLCAAFSGSLTFSSAYFGQGTGPSYSFHCSGTESSLLDCIHVKQNNCSHNADAGVRCQGEDCFYIMSYIIYIYLFVFDN